MAAGGELGAQVGEVVQLAVEHRDDVSALALDGLVAELGIEHLQALVAENTGAVCVGGSLVGSAVAEPGAHLVDEGRLRLDRRRIESADPAHAPQCA